MTQRRRQHADWNKNPSNKFHRVRREPICPNAAVPRYIAMIKFTLPFVSLLVLIPYAVAYPPQSSDSYFQGGGKGWTGSTVVAKDTMKIPSVFLSKEFSLYTPVYKDLTHSDSRSTKCYRFNEFYSICEDLDYGITAALPLATSISN
ncbi:hypothetical protein BJ165DRAFT_1593501 [Panaeolus papilionaceus]|nr:hypothetical protein BJ165DRAFT_1593501 [Panaeolus papilionaceus]